MAIPDPTLIALHNGATKQCSLVGSDRLLVLAHTFTSLPCFS